MVPLSLVFDARKDLQVGLNMQSAHDRTTQRHDVINFVSNASSSCQSRGFSIELTDRGVVSPRRRRLSLGGVPLRDQRVHSASISLCPRSIRLSSVLGVVRVPLAHVVAAVFTVAFRPCYERARVSLVPPRTTLVNAWLAAVRQAVRRLHSIVKVCVWLHHPAFAASFEPVRMKSIPCSALCSQGWLALIRFTRQTHRRHTACATIWAFASVPGLSKHGDRFGDQTTPTLFLGSRLWSRSAFSGADKCRLSAAVNQQLLSVAVSVAFLRRQLSYSPFVVGHLLSMWLSMIRRTSSAIEMPRRLASRFKNARCGSVNEIICFVMESSIPLGIHWSARGI